MKRHILLSLTLLLQACSTAPFWEVTDADWMPKKIEITVVGSQIAQWCGPFDGVLQGCARRDRVTDTCHVYLRSTQNWRCNVRHEALRHCLGEDHPKYAYSMECV